MENEDLTEEAKKMKIFLEGGFSILLIAERGTGKSRMLGKAGDWLNIKKEKIVEVNCALLMDDQLAKTELFGYIKGAFTGADTKGKDGYIKQAENGILFLDEFHYLSKQVQAKLMLALQTNTDNELDKVMKVGSEKFEPPIKNVKIVCATNRSIENLRELLYPDFYDRIIQYVLELPSIRESKDKIKEYWIEVWKQLQFKNKKEPQKDDKFIDWLKNQNLYGNFRDLQKIAIYYNTFDNLKEQNLAKEKNAFEYAKNQFEMYGSKETENEEAKIRISIDTEKTAKDLENDFHAELVKWASNKYGKDAAKKLDINEKTLKRWGLPNT
jgi:transcriptional regulator with PAS, ATPase and Fis domain